MTTKQDAWVTTMQQCMYGLKTTDAQGEASAYKPTTIVTNHEALAGALSRKCMGGHRHAHLVGKTACTKAAQYPREMCEAVLKAVAVIKKSVEETQLMSVEREDMCENDDPVEQYFASSAQDYFYEGLRDNTIGEELDACQVRTGCDE